MTIKTVTLICLFLFFAGMILTMIWISQMMRILKELKADSRLIHGLGQAALSGDISDTGDFRRAMSYLLSREYAKVGNERLSDLGDRVLGCLVVSVGLAAAMLVLMIYR